jgi:hypothetical protein
VESSKHVRMWHSRLSTRKWWNCEALSFLMKDYNCHCTLCSYHSMVIYYTYNQLYSIRRKKHFGSNYSLLDIYTYRTITGKYLLWLVKLQTTIVTKGN